MSTQKPIKLRTANTVWATLSEDQDGTKQLDLASGLTELQIKSYTGGLGAYRSDGEPLKIERVADQVHLNDRNGITQLTLKMGRNEEVTDVRHPLVTLVIILSGAGSGPKDPIQAGTILFALRWE